MPAVVTKTAYLEINSIPLATAAYWIIDLTPLHGLRMRGQTESVPYLAGGIGYRHRIHQRSFTLPLVVRGRYQNDGTINSNVYSGLDTNVDYLLTNVVTPSSTTTRTAVWHRAGGGTLSAGVFVESFEPTRWGNGWIRFDMELSVPSGQFV